MIRNWLLKHRWVNELGKTILVAGFAWFGWASWGGGKLASLEIVPSESYKLMFFGIITGIMGMLAIFIIIDVVYSLKKAYFTHEKTPE